MRMGGRGAAVGSRPRVTFAPRAVARGPDSALPRSLGSSVPPGWQTGGMTRAAAPRRVAIVGGGIAGLAAAYFLRDAPVSVTVYEGSPRPGGKLAVSDVAGIATDEGAEALLTRRPEGTDLIRAVGLADQLVTPGTLSARVSPPGALPDLPPPPPLPRPPHLPQLPPSHL